ncbi:MAG TPA: glycosyltransferase family 4 protein, partial [Thermoplasmata archaeon]|nr:glycosyltransferase family 4 protein [Thermoplasmata archaeon]
RFDAYTADTVRELDQLRSFGVPSDRLRLVPLGVSLHEFGARPAASGSVRERYGCTRPRLAVYAGGFFENKRVDRLVESIALRKDRWSLLAIGRDVAESPANAGACQRLAAERGVELRVPGVLDRPATLAALFAADVIVLGSQYEGFGLLPVEAMAAGRPFVAFDSGAASMLAATGAGSCVRTPQEFAAALDRLEDPAERARIGGLGLRAVAEYSEAAMVRRYLAVYEEVLARRARPRSDGRGSARRRGPSG